MKVLVADDDLTSRTMLGAILKKSGYEPTSVADGAAAWDALRAPDPPMLVLLDWNMPAMDGLEVCRLVRQNESSNPPYIILLTGRGEKGDIVHGLEAGANDYISKPYDTEELQARISVGRRMIELQSNLVEARDAVVHQALYDHLTDIFNRRAILEQLKRELVRARRGEGWLAVGICDIDHFKTINDTWGHQTGDEALVAFTRCVQASLREYDCVGRYGGEEFLVIASGGAGGESDGLFERVRARLASAPIETAAGTVSMTVSIGVANAAPESTVDDLLAAADAALYRAKEAGRNRVVHAE